MLDVMPRTFYRATAYRPDPHGRLFRDGVRRSPIWSETFHNLVTDAGREYVLRRSLLGQALPTFNDGALDAVRGRRYPDGRRTPRAWTTGTKAVGDVCQPTTPNGHMYLCIVGGASGGSEPGSWSTTAGASVTDGSATWVEASLFYIGLKGQGSPAHADRMDSHGSWTEITSYSETTRQAFIPAAITSPQTSNAASLATFTFAADEVVYGCFMTDHPTKGGTTGLLYGPADLPAAKDVPGGGALDVTGTVSIG